jgi:hypothetical protein
LENRVGLRRCLFHRRPAFQPHHRRIPGPCLQVREHVARLRDGQRDLQFSSRVQTAEFWRCHPDDREDTVGKRDGLADSAGIAAESPLPVSVPNHRDWRIELLVIHGQEAPGGGFDTKHVEIAAGSDLTLDLFQRAIDFQSQLVASDTRHSGERGRFMTNPLEVRIRRCGAAAFAAAALDVEQLLRPLDRQRAQQHGVHKGEDRGVRSDTEREGQDCGDREARRVPQQSQTVPHVLRGVGEPADSTRVAALFLESDDAAKFAQGHVARLINAEALCRVLVYQVMEVFP